jgi:hypothetical protein
VVNGGPVSDATAQRFIDGVLRHLSTTPKHRHHARRKAARSLGGIADQCGLTLAEVEGWILAALPVLDHRVDTAKAAIAWGFENGQKNPRQLLGRTSREFDSPTLPEPPPPDPDDPGPDPDLGPEVHTPAPPPPPQPPPLDPRTEWLARERLVDAPPPIQLPTATPDVVYAETLHAERVFFAERHRFRLYGKPPMRRLLIAPTGSKKTRSSVALLAETIRRDQAERERELLAANHDPSTPHRWIRVVPAHRLGRQITDLDRCHGIDNAIFEGRDPGNNKNRTSKCTQLESVRLTMKAHAAVNSSTCGKSIDLLHQCCDRRGCAYFAQYLDAKGATVVTAAHQFLFEELPEIILHDVCGIIVEEDFTTAGDLIRELSIDSMRERALITWPALYKLDKHYQAKNARMIELFEHITDMLDHAPDDYLDGHLATSMHGLTTDEIEELIDLNNHRKVAPEMYPGMALQD